MHSLLNIVQTFVVLFGALITLLSLIGVVRPRRLIDMVSQVWKSPPAFWLAIGVRVLIGSALIVSAHTSLLPRAFMVLGWLLLLSAGGILIAGRNRVTQLLGWFSDLPILWIRAWCTVGAVFGASLVYGVMGPA